MGRIVVDHNEYDNIINNNTNEIKNNENNVIFENIYEEILKMSANYKLQNTISNKIIDNSRKQLGNIIKREAIWFDK
jgi:hypothetical protein